MNINKKIDIKDLYHFNPYKVQVPTAGKSLCKKALDYAFSNIDLFYSTARFQLLYTEGNVSYEEFVTGEIKRYTLRALNNPIAQEIYFSEMADNGMNVFPKLKSYFMSPEDLLQSKNYQEKLSSLNSKYETVYKLSIISLILFYIFQMTRAEENLMVSSNDKDYSVLFLDIDGYLFKVHQLLSNAKIFDVLHAQSTLMLKRKIGAKKGGIGKSKRQAELKAMILMEANALHSKKNSAEAARQIYNKLGGKSTWLKDEEGKKLLEDPVNRFTVWIRSSRK